MNEKELLSLLQKYRENRLSAIEHARLRAWMDESPANRLLLENFIKLYKLDNQCQAVPRLDVPGAWETFCRRRRRISLHRAFRRFVAAASLLLVLGVGLYAALQLGRTDDTAVADIPEIYARKGSHQALLTLSSGKKISLQDSVLTVDEKLLAQVSDSSVAVQQNVVEVPRGGEFSMLLPDGTKVWLNAASLLRFPSRFEGKRVVELEGEAYFEVAKTGHPFEVHVAGAKVRVLGTHFNVSAYEETPTQVTLVEGGVEVSNEQGRVKLVPGQQAEIKSSETGITVRTVNTSRYVAWVTGVFDFDDTSMEEIVSVLSRWYDVEIEIASPALKKMRFSGTFLREETLGYTLEMLGEVSHMEVSVEEEKIILRK